MAASNFDKLVSDYEFQNQQQVKLIEHEDYLLAELENDATDKEADIKRLEKSTIEVEINSMQCKKQFTINRDNQESLKKTSQVMNDAVEAMKVKKDNTAAKIKQEKEINDAYLQKKEQTWQHYLQVYEARPLAKELRQQESLNETTKRSNQEKENFIKVCKMKIEQVKGGSNLYKSTTNEFIVKLATMRSELIRLAREVHELKAEQIQKEASLQRQRLEETAVMQRQQKEKEAAMQRHHVPKSAMHRQQLEEATAMQRQQIEAATAMQRQRLEEAGSQRQHVQNEAILQQSVTDVNNQHNMEQLSDMKLQDSDTIVDEHSAMEENTHATCDDTSDNAQSGSGESPMVLSPNHGCQQNYDRSPQCDDLQRTQDDEDNQTRAMEQDVSEPVFTARPLLQTSSAMPSSRPPTAPMQQTYSAQRQTSVQHPTPIKAPSIQGATQAISTQPCSSVGQWPMSRPFTPSVQSPTVPQFVTVKCPTVVANRQTSVQPPLQHKFTPSVRQHFVQSSPAPMQRPVPTQLRAPTMRCIAPAPQQFNIAPRPVAPQRPTATPHIAAQQRPNLARPQITQQRPSISQHQIAQHHQSAQRPSITQHPILQQRPDITQNQVEQQRPNVTMHQSGQQQPSLSHRPVGLQHPGAFQRPASIRHPVVAPTRLMAPQVRTPPMLMQPRQPQQLRSKESLSMDSSRNETYQVSAPSQQPNKTSPSQMSVPSPEENQSVKKGSPSKTVEEAQSGGKVSPNVQKCGERIVQPDGCVTYFVPMKDDSSDERTDSPSQELGKSPVDAQKQRRILDALFAVKSPGVPNNYLAPVKRPFTEVDGNHQKNEDGGIPQFGMAPANGQTIMNAGDASDNSNKKSSNDGRKFEDTAFSLFPSFTDGEDQQKTSSGDGRFSIFNMTSSPPGDRFSAFKQSEENNEAFPFSFGDNSTQPGNQETSGFGNMFNFGGMSDSPVKDSPFKFPSFDQNDNSPVKDSPFKFPSFDQNNDTDANDDGGFSFKFNFSENTSSENDAKTMEGSNNIMSLFGGGPSSPQDEKGFSMNFGNSSPPSQSFSFFK